MKVRLIGYTQPAEDFKDEFSSVKDLIAFCARVSNPSNQYNTETADKLINYLVRNKHWSPLEMASATIEVETTRDIARQLLRHRSFSFQEFSQRYADPTKDLEFEYREARFQDAKNRQNSVELDMSNPEHRELNNFWIEMQRKVINASRDAYVWAITNGIAKEQARAVLPEGNMASRLYVHGTIRSYVHYIEVRTDPSTQKEHRLLAKAVAEAINKIFSITM
jgi:thymidylate synthase (FAD)